MQAATQRAFGLVRQAVMAIPDRLARDMAGFPSDRVAVWRRDARGYCQEALTDAASTIRDMAEAVAGDIEFVDYGEGEEGWILDRVAIDGIPRSTDGKPVLENLQPF